MSSAAGTRRHGSARGAQTSEPVGRPRRDLSPRAAGWALATLVAGSTLAYGLTTGRVQNIWILPDELIYGLLARSFATTGHFALRGVNTLTAPIGYPLLLSPAFVARGPVSAYDAARWLNALLMSLAAVPVFLLGRRLLPNWLSLLGVALTLLIPSFAYTGVLLSENAFFPLTLFALLAFVRALERPSAGRQVVALAAIVPAVAARAEGLVLVPVLVGAIVLLALADASRGPGRYARGLWHELSRFGATAVVFPLSIVVIVLGEAAAGRSPTSLMGRYAGSLRAYALVPTLRWAVYQLIDLELYLAVIPFVPAILVAASMLRRADVPRGRRAVAATSISAVVFFVLAAAAASYGNQGGGNNYPSLPPELHDRYCFFVAPLYLLFFLHWVHRRRDFSNRILLAGLVAGAALPLLLPYADVHSNAEFDALALLPWNNSLIANRNVHYAMAVTAALLGLVLVSRRSSFVLLQVGLVATLMWFMGLLARQEIATASAKVRSSWTRQPSWVDRAVPRGARVAALWAPPARWSLAAVIHHEQALWRAEFLNPTVRSFFYLATPMHYDLPESRVRLVDGRLLLPPGETHDYRYLLVASPVGVDGRVVARDRRAGLTLYRLHTPARPAPAGSGANT